MTRLQPNSSDAETTSSPTPVRSEGIQDVVPGPTNNLATARNHLVNRPVVVIQVRKGWRLIDWREIVQYRDLLYFMTLRDVTILYKQTVLGCAWAILNPVFSMLIFIAVFGLMAKIPSDGIPKPIFYYSALLPWTYFAQSLTGSTNSLLQGMNLFTKVYFPRVFMPLVPVFSKLVDFSIALVVLAGLMIWYKIAPSRQIVFLPLLILLMVTTAAGIGMWSSALALQFRDVRHAITFGVQILMYAAPVVWPVSLIARTFGDHAATVRLFYGLYPMAGVIEGFRSAIIGRNPMPWDLIGMGAISAILLLFSGAMYFRRTEAVFADVV